MGVVTQPSTSHYLFCVQCGSVCVRVLLCLVFIIAVHLGNKVIFYQLSSLTLLVAVNSRNATQTISSPSVLETVSIREMNLRNTAEGGGEPVTYSVAGECFSHSATVNR